MKLLGEFTIVLLVYSPPCLQRKSLFEIGPGFRKRVELIDPLLRYVKVHDTALEIQNKSEGLNYYSFQTNQIIFTARQRSCGKVPFSQVSVIVFKEEAW